MLTIFRTAGCLKPRMKVIGDDCVSVIWEVNSIANEGVAIHSVRFTRNDLDQQVVRFNVDYLPVEQPVEVAVR